MATELAFAKSFLSQLDGRPVKISADHMEDPRSYPASPPYILPRHPSYKPFSKRARTTTTTTTTTSTSTNTAAAADQQQQQQHEQAQSAKIAVTLRSPRNPPLELTLAGREPHTPAAELKEAVAAETGVAVDKIKLLHGKRPVADSKALKEFVGGGSNEVEFTVMILGGAATVAAAAAAKAKAKEQEQEQGQQGQGQGQGQGQEGGSVAQGLSGRGVLETEEFWGDLRGFLQQRVRDEAVAGEACEVFREAWAARR